VNTITLLALVLAIGLVVDDAIVMLENIYRHIENGMEPFAAALKGSKEIVFAIIAMTLTLVAVYLPIAFTQGLTGILFRQFALTLAGAVVISGFVALTLSPMMSARLLKPVDKSSRFSQWLDKVVENLMTSYKNLLRKVLAHRPWVVIALLLMVALGWWLHSTMPSELAPTEDRGSIRGIISAPTNSSFEYTNRYAKQIEEIYASIPEAKGYLMSVGFPTTSSAFSILSLKPWNKRERSQQEIVNELRKKFRQVAGLNAFPASSSPFRRGGSSNNGIEMRIMSPSSYANLESLTNSLATEINKYPGILNVDTSMKMDNQQFNIHINRNLAADLGVNLTDISDSIETLLGGKVVTSFDFDGQGYNVMLQMQRKDLKDLQGLDKIYVRSIDNKMIPLSTLINVTPEVGPVMLPHFDRLRSDDISADVAPGYTVGEVVTYLRAFMKTHLPNNAKYTFSGSVKDFLQSHNRMNMIFLLALAFFYLVLAAQFESFIDPFIVLLSVPLSIVGGLFVLRLAGGTLNIYSQIGLVTLIGLVAKHGILITEFANQMRAEAKDNYTAVVEASALRLRPILMITCAMVLGALPLALAGGAGAISRQQVGWVIVGGMSFGTFFSLFVAPTAYIYLAKYQRKNRFLTESV
jgi:multidrug efflux pump